MGTSLPHRDRGKSLSAGRSIVCLVLLLLPYPCSGSFGDHINREISSPLVTEFSPTDTRWRSTRDGVEVLPHTEHSFLPQPWNSDECLEHWEMSHLKREADPNGYYLVTHSREQLGGVTLVLADAMFVARSLNRTLVELPVVSSMVAGASNWKHGIGMYFDMDALCQSHRALDLRTFISLVESGEIPQSSFITITEGYQPSSHVVSNLETEANVVDFMEELGVSKALVLVGNEVHKTEKYERKEMGMVVPNPFYLSVVEDLLVKQGWYPDKFISVQWRTEQARGNLTDCYLNIVKEAVEKHRTQESLDTGNVFFNTDMAEGSSTSYHYKLTKRDRKGDTKEKRIKKGRVKAAELISQEYGGGGVIWEGIGKYDDPGIKSIVSGLVSAHARTLLVSSTQNERTKMGQEQRVGRVCDCHKRRSKYVALVIHWRKDILGKAPGSVTGLFDDPLQGENMG